MDNCILCNEKLKLCDSHGALNQLFRVVCPRCGRYDVTENAELAEPERFVKERLHLISAVTRRHSERNIILRINEKLLVDISEFEARILSLCPRTTQEKMNSILTYIAEKSSYPGQMIQINRYLDYPLFYCKGMEELEFYFGHLEFMGLVGRDPNISGPMRLMLSGEGWKVVEEQTKPNIESKQTFVAMWFDDELKSAYSDGIAKLEEDIGFSMLRVDMKQFNEKICDRILSEIRRSRFLIADVTGHRQGVYFEAGFAMGLGLPVIWTCRDDQIKFCHFDTRQYNHITWKDADELYQKLRDRILATIGKAKT